MSFENESTTYIVEFKWDDDAAVWYALNDEIPVALESGSLDVLMERVKIAVPEILSLNGKDPKSSLKFSAERYLEAV